MSYQKVCDGCGEVIDTTECIVIDEPEILDVEDDVLDFCVKCFVQMVLDIRTKNGLPLMIDGATRNIVQERTDNK